MAGGYAAESREPEVERRLLGVRLAIEPEQDEVQASALSELEGTLGEIALPAAALTP